MHPTTQLFHIHPKSPCCRHSPGRCMRLLQEPPLGQLGHLISHCSRTKPHAFSVLQPRNRPRTHRFSGLDIALNDGRQNSSLPRRHPLRIRHPFLRPLNSTPAVKLRAYRHIVNRTRKGRHRSRSDRPPRRRLARKDTIFQLISSTSSLLAAISFAFSATFLATS